MQFDTKLMAQLSTAMGLMAIEDGDLSALPYTVGVRGQSSLPSQEAEVMSQRP
jgi:hypothetical protein